MRKYMCVYDMCIYTSVYTHMQMALQYIHIYMCAYVRTHAHRGPCGGNKEPDRLQTHAHTHTHTHTHTGGPAVQGLPGGNTEPDRLGGGRNSVSPDAPGQRRGIHMYMYINVYVHICLCVYIIYIIYIYMYCIL